MLELDVALLDLDLVEDALGKRQHVLVAHDFESLHSGFEIAARLVRQRPFGLFLYGRTPDPEVQQTRLPVFAHQDVAGLEVAVDHAAFVCLGDGFEHFQEELDTRANIQALFPTVVDVPTLNALENEVRLTFVGSATVEKARDVLVVQTRQGLPFAQKALHRSVSGTRGGARDLRMFAWVSLLLEHDPGEDGELDPESGEAFGPYETVRSLAVGGMGEVLLGRRSDGEFEREVAIKRLRFGGGSEPSFASQPAEKQSLGTSEDPALSRCSIAR